MNTIQLPPLYADLPLTENEKQILYLKQITGTPGSYGKNIGSLKVEFIQHSPSGKWAYKVHTHKKTGYETSPGFIESKPSFSYNGAAESGADKIIDLYWMACNEND